MKRKIIIGGLCITLALSLISCGKQQAQPEGQEPSQGVQQTNPATTPTIEPTTTPVEIKQEVPQQSGTGPEESTPPVETSPVDTTGGAGGDVDVTPDEEVQLFNDVNEVVYATGTVNIRASWSASSDKLGSLSRGQSVTRTGTSIAGTEADGWSRVTLADGSTAYISNQYLSTTKPTQQSTGTNNGGTTTQTPSTGTQGTTTQTPSNNTGSTGSSEEDLARKLQEMYNNGSYIGSDTKADLTPEEAAEIAGGLIPSN